MFANAGNDNPDRTTTFAYDKEGNTTQVKNALNDATNNAFDPLNRLINTAAPDAGTTNLSYNAKDEVVSHQDALAVQTSFVRDGFGEVLRETSPDRGSTTYYYDAAGAVSAVIDGRGQRVNYARDILGRLTSKTPVGLAAQAVTYGYDGGAYGKGNLTQVTDASGVTALAYDHRGNLISKTQNIGGTAAALAYSYDKADRIVSITYPSGRIVTYVRDGKGRVASVLTKPSAAALGWTTLASAITYESFGSLTSATYGNGLKLDVDWGNDGRLTARRLYTAATGANLSVLSYAYDNDDNITAITDGVDASASSSFAYDNRGRLIRASSGAGGTGGTGYQRQDYSYDKNGNRTGVERRTLASDAAAAESDSYTKAPGTNRLASVSTLGGTRSFTHDARGNLISETRPGTPSPTNVTASYDGYGRLTEHTQSGAAALSFSYNGLDDRVSQSEGGVVQRFVYDSMGRIVGEYATSPSAIRGEYIYLHPDAANDNPSPHGGDDGLGGYGLLTIMTPDASAGGAITAHYPHSNHLGAPLFSTDASGAVVTPGAYAQPVFPGQLRTRADLYYNRHRDYDPTTGRYIQADPLGLDGDANPYLYANGNPMRYVDPTGEYGIVGAGMGAGGELLTQAIYNYATGRSVFDVNCYEWGEVAFAGAMGAIGGNWVKGWVKFTPGSMKWNNVSRRIRRAEDMIGKPEDLHHWLVPQRLFKNNPLGEKLFNRPWNLNKLPRKMHSDIHKDLNALDRLWQGSPEQFRQAAGLGGVGAGLELLDGYAW
jgi:RHS repeat-associated protein